MGPKSKQDFQQTIYSYYNNHGRHDLPWRNTNNPYHIFVSEIMLQQTQVDRVIPKYQQFIKGFPTIESLAQAPLREVLQSWQGLGYNRRGKNLQQAAQIIHTQYQNKIQETREGLIALPGVGPYTASALQAFIYNKPVTVIETNIRTVYFHFYFENKTKITDNELLPIIKKQWIKLSLVSGILHLWIMESILKKQSVI